MSSEQEVREEIRQLREEIAEMEMMRGYAQDWYSWVNDGPWVSDEGVAPHIQRYVRRSRILSRLEAELARLTAGMREQG